MDSKEIKMYSSALSACLLFRDTEPALIYEALSAPGSSIEKFDAAEMIFSGGSSEKKLGIILYGKAVITKGDDRILLKNIGKGDLFGAATLFSDTIEIYTEIKAKTPVQILFICEEGVKALMAKSPAFSIRYVEILSEKIRFLNHKLDAFTTEGSQTRFAKYLLDHEKGGTLLIPASYDKLAKTLGIGRASLYRAMDILASKDIIVREKKQILIRDKTRLQKMTENK